MTVHDLRNADGAVYAFEVSSSVGPRGATHIVSTIPGVKILDLVQLPPQPLEGIRCEFELGGVRFEIWEPYGDSSRYWVGPEPVRPTPELSIVREALANAHHSWWRL